MIIIGDAYDNNDDNKNIDDIDNDDNDNDNDNNVHGRCSSNWNIFWQ